MRYVPEPPGPEPGPPEPAPQPPAPEPPEPDPIAIPGRPAGTLAEPPGRRA